jgi:hypothetical protein
MFDEINNPDPVVLPHDLAIAFELHEKRANFLRGQPRIKRRPLQREFVNSRNRRQRISEEVEEEQLFVRTQPGDVGIVPKPRVYDSLFCHSTCGYSFAHPWKESSPSGDVCIVRQYKAPCTRRGRVESKLDDSFRYLLTNPPSTEWTRVVFLKTKKPRQAPPEEATFVFSKTLPSLKAYGHVFHFVAKLHDEDNVSLNNVDQVSALQSGEVDTIPRCTRKDRSNN